MEKKTKLTISGGIAKKSIKNIDRAKNLGKHSVIIFISKFNNFVASLTFCPLLPIALLKFSSVRITSNFFLSKSTFTL